MSVKKAWLWGPAQEQAFNQIKEELIKPSILTLYDPTAKTKVSADASSFGLGAVLLQEQDGSWKPVAYVSRAMSKTEQRYAQIEKEALAVTWACEKFVDYVLGCSITIETDHKPLVPLLNTKCLNMLPPCVLHFRLRLSRFEYTVFHVPGKLLYTADTLSRAPTVAKEVPTQLQESVEAYVRESHSFLPSQYSKIGSVPPVSAAGSRVSCNHGLLPFRLAYKVDYRPTQPSTIQITSRCVTTCCYIGAG